MFIKLFLIALPVFFIIDMVWLVLVAKKFYQSQIGFLMNPDINSLNIITAMKTCQASSRSFAVSHLISSIPYTT
jgi:uncharacterized membrane protein